jgi:hypothetical protein
MNRMQVEKIIKYRKLHALGDKLESMNLNDDARLTKAIAMDIFLALTRSGIRPLDILITDYSHILNLTNAEW